MKDLSRRLDIALIIITHNLGVVARYADRVNVMYAARIVEQGTADDVFLRPLHPYTHRPDALGAAARPAARRQASKPSRGCRPTCARRRRLPLRAALSASASTSAARTRCCARSQPATIPPAGAPSELSRRHARRAPLPPKPTLHATTSGTDVPLLEVEGLHKYFEIKRQAPASSRRGPAIVKAVDDVSFTIAPGETLGLVGEFGLRQDDGRPHHAAARRADRRRDRVRRRRHHATARPHEMRAVRRKMQVIFQDPYSSLNPRMTVGQIIGEPLSVHRLVADRKAAHASGSRNCCSSGRPVPLHGGALPARAVGRPAPARRHRARARARADASSSATSRSPRSTSRSRPRSSTCSRTCRRGSVSPTCSSPTTSRWCATSRDRVAVMYLGRHRRGRRPRRALRQSAASLHPGAAGRRADPRSDGRARARAARPQGRECPQPLNPPSGCVFHTRCPIAGEECRREIRPGATNWASTSRRLS